MGFRVFIVAALLLGGCRSVNVETEPVTGRVFLFREMLDALKGSSQRTNDG